MSFPEKPTTKDLSSTKELNRFPGFNSSMQNGNTVTDKNPDFAGQGTPSEASTDVVAKNVSYVGYSHETPDLPGSSDESHVNTDETGSGYTPAPHTWKEV